MGSKIKRLALVLVVLAWFAAPACADFDTGMAAFERGDYKAAFREWKPLADKGDVKAQAGMAELYLNGFGVPQDYKEAVRWHRRRADQGDVRAQFTLGVWYEEGHTVQQDYVQAHMWYNLAAAQGDEGAGSLRDALAKKMTVAQIEKAQKLAREWKPKKEAKP